MAVDWTGKILVTVTWGLFLFANCVTLTQIFDTWFIHPTSTSSILPYTTTGKYLLIIYELLNFLATTSHICAVFGDPGTTFKLVAKEPPENYSRPRICKACGLRWKPPRAHHCGKCQICVYRMDHHCAWIDNCVGILNQKFFILFLIYSAVLCAYQLFLIFLSIVFWISNSAYTIALIPTCLVASVVAESLVFLHMTTDIFSEQLDALETNSSLVESHQHTHGPQKAFWDNVTDVFGSNKASWLLPIPPRLKLDFTEPVFLDKSIAVCLKKHAKRQALHQSSSKILSKPISIKQEPFPNDSNTVHKRRTSKRHLEHFESKPIPEDPLTPPPDFDSDLMEWLGQSNNKKHDTGDKLVAESENSSSRDSTYRESLFKNIYMRPWVDIGVELDDESRFVNLVESDGDDAYDHRNIMFSDSLSSDHWNQQEKMMDSLVD